MSFRSLFPRLDYDIFASIDHQLFDMCNFSIATLGMQPTIFDVGKVRCTSQDAFLSLMIENSFVGTMITTLF